MLKTPKLVLINEFMSIAKSTASENRIIFENQPTVYSSHIINIHMYIDVAIYQKVWARVIRANFHVGRPRAAK